MSFRIPFETTVQQRLRALRRDDGQSTPTRFKTVEGSVVPWTGDDTSPYVGPLARASADALAGLVEVEDGDNQRIASDRLGRLWVQQAGAPIPGAATAKNSTAATNLVVKATAGVLYQIRCITAAAVVEDRFLQVFDANALPSAGAAPVWEALIPAGQTTATTFAEAADDFDPLSGLTLSTGITLGLSTTPGVLTIAGSEGFFMASYV